jgi:hypothetical protein
MTGEFERKWNPRNGTDVNDAILAATVLKTGGKIVTLLFSVLGKHNHCLTHSENRKRVELLAMAM